MPASVRLRRRRSAAEGQWIEVREPSRDALGPDRAAEILRLAARRLGLSPRQEHFLVLTLNARARPCRVRVVSTGTLTSCLVHPREVFRPALVDGASSIVAAHNHPSGSVEPSDEDMRVTEALIAAGRILQVPVADHLVLALGPSGEWASVPADYDPASASRLGGLGRS